MVYARFKVKPEDFIVEEITKDGNICSIENASESIPDEQRDFLWCNMIKYNIDEFRAIKEMASLLKKGIDAIGFAGVKDKKAITSQQISIFKPDINRIKNFNHPHIKLVNFKWNKRKIKMGYLFGNQFQIILRDIDSKDSIKVSNLIRKTKYFPNYFGKQRFGSVRENNADIGKLIVKRKFKEAISEILTSTNKKEREEVINARKRLAEEKDYKKAIEYFPPFLKFERSILQYLSEHNNDYIGALKNINKKQVLMFVHALQSKIFNEVLEIAFEKNFDFSKKGQQKIQLIGYKSKEENTEVGAITSQVLKKHGLTKEDFNLKEIPFLRISGSLRDAMINVKNLDVQILDDDLFSGSKKILLKFSLDSGVYATTFLENFFELDEKVE